MKILMVHNIYRPFKRGGAEVVFEAFVDELKKEHEVVVVTAGKEQKFSIFNFSAQGGSASGGQFSKENGVTVIRFMSWNIFSIHDIDRKPFWQRVVWHALDVWNPQSYFFMKKILREVQPDVVWTHSLKGVGYMSFCAIKQWRKKVPITNYQLPITSRWILTPHNEELVFQFGYALSPFRIGVFEKLTMLITRRLTRGVDLVFAPSHQIIEFHQRLGFWKGAHVSSDWPVFVNKRITNYELRITGDRNKQLFTFGFIGQLEEHKGIMYLIRAFKSYVDQDIRLVMAGRGTLAEQIKNEIKNDNRITFLGEYTGADLPELFSQINALVVPSTIRDNMPTVILESFAYGRPVIGSNLGGIPEIVRGAKSKIRGILLNSLDEHDFHQAFDEMQKPEVYQGFVENIQKWQPLSVHESLQKIGIMV